MGVLDLCYRWRSLRWPPGVRVHFSLHLDLETNIDVTRRVPTSNTPILFGTLSGQYFYLVVRNTKRFQISNNRFIEIALCIQRATSEAIDADMGKVFWLIEIWPAHKPMGQISY